MPKTKPRKAPRSRQQAACSGVTRAQVRQLLEQGYASGKPCRARSKASKGAETVQPTAEAIASPLNRWWRTDTRFEDGNGQPIQPLPLKGPCPAPQPVDVEPAVDASTYKPFAERDPALAEAMKASIERMASPAPDTDIPTTAERAEKQLADALAATLGIVEAPAQPAAPEPTPPPSLIPEAVNIVNPAETANVHPVSNAKQPDKKLISAWLFAPLDPLERLLAYVLGFCLLWPALGTGFAVAHQTMLAIEPLITRWGHAAVKLLG